MSRLDIDAMIVIFHDPIFMAVDKMHTVGSFLTPVLLLGYITTGMSRKRHT